MLCVVEKNLVSTHFPFPITYFPLADQKAGSFSGERLSSERRADIIRSASRQFPPFVSTTKDAVG